MKLKLIAISFLVISFNAFSEKVSLIKKGTILTCPKNNEPILELKTDITLYKEFSIDDFKFLKEYPPELEKQIPCEVIKELCYHIDNKWIGFSDDCILIPRNAGRYTYKEFIDNSLKVKQNRESILKQKMDCSVHEVDKRFEICTTVDKKWKCLKSEIYKNELNSNEFGPCTKND